MNSFYLPIIVEKDSNYYSTLCESLDCYLQVIESNKIEIDIRNDIYTICQEIKETIRLYYSSQINSAYLKVKRIIEFVTNRIPNCICSIQDIFGENKETFFYKARIGEPSENYKQEDLLHIPFNLRGRVPNTRFSINGCPCIYLGTTSLITWLELGKPVYNNFYVSCFRITGKIQVLNFIKEDWDKLSGELNNGKIINDNREELLLFPLILATSFIVKEKDRVFKSEYIISQLIMQIMASQNRGVVYFSKRTFLQNAVSVCVAIPAIPCEESMINSLGIVRERANLIDINGVMENTVPCNYSDFLALPISARNYETSCGDIIYGAQCSLANRGLPYSWTDFYQFDRYLIDQLKKKSCK